MIAIILIFSSIEGKYFQRQIFFAKLKYQYIMKASTELLSTVSDK